jgi:hypothetical protein
MNGGHGPERAQPVPGAAPWIARGVIGRRGAPYLVIRLGAIGSLAGNVSSTASSISFS